MMICIAPAKRMRKDIAYLDAQGTPKLLKETKQLAKIMQQQDVSALRHILSCSERIAQEAYQIFQTMQLTQNVVPALLAYDGIQYTYMAPDIFSDEQFAYVQKHLRILSGFYGVLKPLDGVVPYRLEINSLLRTDTFCNLYAFGKISSIVNLSKNPLSSLIWQVRNIAVVSHATNVMLYGM